MLTDTLLKNYVMRIISEQLGTDEAERLIALIR
jgi:hypothetical protein